MVFLDGRIVATSDFGDHSEACRRQRGGMMHHDRECRDWRLAAALIWACAATFACAMGWAIYIHDRARGVPDFATNFDHAYQVYLTSKDTEERRNAQAILTLWILRGVEALRSPRDYFEAVSSEAALQRINDATKVR
jgi:hypothetical protein